ncbi:late secretory pathway protein AVL9 homolog [Episyrphus balteatus]|uniref:late secretory pathway protein AVL9 homolog n=1 Tax=Episyrphus balteatus TaxID=286459 RepID=UPI00248613E3|nr:late secretory pathway protein AVL9 homolog [Episyrphus balteatus]
MSEKPPILHILVVGFHHKLGCQVEFSYPPLIVDTEGKNECPSGWKYLPTLALPDGSHNYLEDTVFFNLPSLLDPTESIFGVSCYRQIPVEKLKIRTADVTRSTVQKSVCILSRLPIYGYIEVKLSLIADAFFDQGDFSCTDILVKAYNQLNACLVEEPRALRHFYVGISLREIVLKWRHKTLILFKLFLLQRRVVFFASPVRGMCCLILGISSLIPRLLEKGFQEVACVRTSRPMSPMPDFSNTQASDDENVKVENDLIEPPTPKIKDENGCAINHPTNEKLGEISESISSSSSPVKSSPESNREFVRTDSNGAEVGKRIDRSNSLTRETSMDTLESNMSAMSSINPDEYRSPITIFASGNLCLPYLSLPYMDLLSDPSVLSYVIGTSNVLFQQKRNLADIQVDVENCTIEAHDPDLRKQLSLTTEDLRFMEYLMRHVQNPKEDAQGSEFWIREQFQGYMLSLLRTAVVQDSPKDCDHFNSNFMSTFKRTQCFQEWYDVRPEPSFFENLPSGHLFAGTLSYNDMRNKIAHSMQNSESGRKINLAVTSTSKAVGGAISQAKGALSNWWSSVTTAPPSTTPANPPQNSAIFHTDGSDAETNDADSEEANSPNKKKPEIISNIPENLVTEKLEKLDSAEESVEDETQKRAEGIVEIAKEAELLDANSSISSNSNNNSGTRKNGEVFVV